MSSNTTLPTDYKERKSIPIGTGVLDYFPLALVEVAKVSKVGNDQHNAGQPLHWQRGKSTDHYDTLTRHGMERGTIDTDGMRHSAKMAWRALALLQEELEAVAGDGRISRGSWPAEEVKLTPEPVILTNEGPLIPDPIDLSDANHLPFYCVELPYELQCYYLTPAKGHPCRNPGVMDERRAQALRPDPFEI